MTYIHIKIYFNLQGGLMTRVIFVLLFITKMSQVPDAQDKYIMQYVVPKSTQRPLDA